MFCVLQKKRKQASRDADSLSLCSLDINVSSAPSSLITSLLWLNSGKKEKRKRKKEKSGEMCQKSMIFPEKLLTLAGFNARCVFTPALLCFPVLSTEA